MPCAVCNPSAGIDTRRAPLRWMTVTADKDGRGGTDALSNIRCRPRNEFSPRGLRTLRHTTRDLGTLGQRGISPTSGGRARPTSPIDPRYGNRCRPNAARIGAYSACGRRDARRERGSAYLLSSSRLRPTKPNRAITQSMAVMAMALGSIASSVWYLISAHRQPENRLIDSKSRASVAATEVPLALPSRCSIKFSSCVTVLVVPLVPADRKRTLAERSAQRGGDGFAPL